MGKGRRQVLAKTNVRGGSYWSIGGGGSLKLAPALFVGGLPSIERRFLFQ